MSSRGLTSGRGLVRTIYRMSLEEHTKLDHWTPSSTKGYHILNLHGNPDLDIHDKRTDYQVAGHLAALYMTHLSVGPDPISPFVILAASIEKLQQFNFTLGFAKAIIPDEETMNRVELILTLRPEDAVNPSDISKAWFFELAIEMEVMVSII
jgi:hypothetical protein